MSLIRPQLSPVWSTELSLLEKTVDTNLALEGSYTFWSVKVRHGFEDKPNFLLL